MTPKRRSTVTPTKDPTLFEMGKLEEAGRLANALKVERPYSEPGLFLGTSSFTASGWEGSFYPKGMRSTDYLAFYATQFATVEIDSTFYGCPSASTVSKWSARTPEDFLFCVKIPQIITHEKVLVDCDSEFEEFVNTMDILGPKLGPMVFQFPSFDRWKFPKQESFLVVLTPFLKKLPKDHKFVVEIRNKTWLDATFAEVLREHNVALALTDASFVPRPWEMKDKFDMITANFAYVRWLGDRHGIEKITQVWDKTVVDRTEDLKNWVQFVRQMVLSRKLRHIFLFANNHFAGHGPATVKQFWDLWENK
ncbi:MAG TPA: DUF72 domain-containing protein [Candidatus Acidoferrum sp.]|jgi:uncharacterized protein YecE (DUF72 family)|nr:DUF72 domain-containing protein [Candidatus Acidoferrum sp.]